MAKIVSIIACPHDPTLPGAQKMHKVSKAAPGAVKALQLLEAQRLLLEQSRPDVLVMIGSDHFGQWFMDNMPQFMVGKAQRLKGPMPDEVSAWGLEQIDLPVHAKLARHILNDGLARGVDFSYSNEFVADHSFTIPLGFLRPENDLPVVPIFINLLAPPVPPGWRYAEVGRVISETIASWDADVRVAIIGTGHMTNYVGSPKMLDLQKEPVSAWDRQVWEMVARQDLKSLLPLCTWDQLFANGNGTPGFLGNVLIMGAAQGGTPSICEMVATTAQPALCFLGWNEHDLEGILA